MGSNKITNWMTLFRICYGQSFHFSHSDSLKVVCVFFFFNIFLNSLLRLFYLFSYFLFFLFFFFWLCQSQKEGSSSLTRDRTWAPCIENTVLATRPSGKSIVAFLDSFTFCYFSKKWCWIFFHILIGYPYIFLGVKCLLTYFAHSWWIALSHLSFEGCI